MQEEKARVLEETMRRLRDEATANEQAIQVPAPSFCQTAAATLAPVQRSA
jgi:hypothetical protein